MILKLFQTDISAFQHPFSLLLAIYVEHIVLGVVRPYVKSFAILFPIAPYALQSLPICVVQHTAAMTFIVFEFSFIDLPIRPVELALAIFLAPFPLAFEHAPIRPLEEASALHDVKLKLALVNLTSRGDSTSVAVAMTVSKEALIDRAIGEDFDASTVRLASDVVDLTSEKSSCFALVEFAKKGFRVCKIFIYFLGKEIKGA